jgi:hypothetical protein
MILKLTRNIVVDEDDELVLIINGNEFFFEYDDLVLIELENYFNILNTKIN